SKEQISFDSMEPSRFSRISSHKFLIVSNFSSIVIAFMSGIIKKLFPEFPKSQPYVFIDPTQRRGALRVAASAVARYLPRLLERSRCAAVELKKRVSGVLESLKKNGPKTE
ncbi:hypothetical protein RZS08_61905, partial [Arthrospira platensis SPKY1]|nr:hypothetical protein [Arthrospira platensis SPKY1]